MLNDAITHINFGTAKTYEHLASKFTFRAEGDGAFEQSIVDKFSPEAPLVESLDDRKFRAFLKKEAALQTPENGTRTAEQGKDELQKILTGSLGDGWTVKEYNAPAGGTPRVTKLELRDGGNTQELYIDRYGRQPEFRLSSSAGFQGWSVAQTIKGTLAEGAVDPQACQEEVFFTKY
jgi:hypothetical protein